MIKSVLLILSMVNLISSLTVLKRKDGKEIGYTISEESMSWINALKHCEYNGGKLAEILDESDQADVEVFLESVDPNGEGYFWIGLSDLSDEGLWTWETSRVEATYFNWDEGQPNNVGGTEHFGVLHPPLTRKWHDCDDLCSQATLYALCQYEL